MNLLKRLSITVDKVDMNTRVLERVIKMLVLLGISIFSFSSLAMNGRTTYQAKIVKPDGYPLEASSVNFRFTVLDSVGSCAIYVEDYAAVNMNQSGGLISFSLGNGSRTFPASGTSMTFQNTFDNSVPAFSCQAPGIYNPGSNDTRKIVMQFNDGNGWQTLPAMTINAVPYAMYTNRSDDSKKLNGKSDTAFAEVSTLAALNCTATQAIKFNNATFSCIDVPPSGSGGGITSVTTSGTVLITEGTASAPVISIQAATVSQDGYLTSLDYAEFKAKLSASSTEIINTLGESATASATVETLVKRDESGNIRLNDLYANAAKINYVDIYRPSTSFNIRLQAPTSLNTNYILNLPTASGTLGQVLSTDGNGNLSWINPSTGSVTSVSAAAPLASTGGANPTISITQATSGTDGYLLSTDWNTFNNKQQATSSAIIATLGYMPADNAASGTYAQKANNLSDLANISQARANLGLGAFATANSIDLGSASATGIIADARLIDQPNVSSGTQYTKLTVDTKGRVISGAQLSASDVTTALGYTPATSTTLTASFVQKAGDAMTGRLNLALGTTTNAPLKFTSGTLLSSAQSGTVEYDGSQLYFTDGSNIRRALATNSSPGSFDNTSSISNTSGNITLSPNNITGSVIVNSSQASISSGTGALVVNGGVGIAGSINAGGNLNLTGAATIGQSLSLSSMTSGSLLFAGSSGLVSEDNSKLFWDGANQRLGLGTNVPAQTLSVSGTSYFSGNVGIGTSSPLDIFHIGTTNANVRLGAGVDTNSNAIIGRAGGLNFHVTGSNVGDLTIRPEATKDIVFGTTPTSATVGSERMRIIASGNVGIGTANPIYQLDTTSTARFSIGSSGGVRVGGGLLRIDSNADAGSALKIIGTQVVVGQNNSAGYGYSGGGLLASRSVGDGVIALDVATAQGTAAALKITQQSSQMVMNLSNALGTTLYAITGGNVGVGTNNPGANLHVMSDSLPAVLIGTSSATQGALYLGNSNHGLIRGPGGTVNFTPLQNDLTLFNAAGNIYLANGNNGGEAVQRLTVTTIGNVGIGTVMPTNALSVEVNDSSSGIVLTNANSTALRYPSVGVVNYAGATGGHPALSMTNSSGTSAAPIALAAGMNLGTLVFSGQTTSSQTMQGARIDANAENSFSANTAPTQLIFSTAGATGSYVNRMIIKSSGNVGIGTSNPQVKLDVVGGISVDGLKVKDLGDSGAAGRWFRVGRIQNTNPINSAETAFFSGQLFVQDDFGNTASLQSAVTFGFGIRSGTIAPILFNAGSSSIRGDPDKWAFQVWKDSSDWHYLYFFQPEYSRYAKFIYQAHGVTESWLNEDPMSLVGAAKIWDSRTDAAQASEFYGGFNVIRGNVGIGTTSPVEKLEIFRNDAADFPAIKLNNQFPTALNNSVGIDFALKRDIGGSTPGAKIRAIAETGNWPATGLAFYTGIPDFSPIAERVRISALGNVGIGTTDPISPLSVAGTPGVAAVSSNPSPRPGSMRLITNSGNSSILEMGLSDAAPFGGWLQASNGGTSGAYPLLLNPSGGNVGIATTAPSEKLHVVGNLRVQGSTDCTLGNGAGGTNCSSDQRLKENIKAIPYALEKINLLRGVQFNWNEKSLSYGRHDIGVIAQDVEKVFPTAVINDKNTGFKKVDYAVLVAPLIQAVKEIYALFIGEKHRNDNQDRRIASIAESKADKLEIEKLKLENQNLQKRLERLEKSLNSKK